MGDRKVSDSLSVTRQINKNIPLEALRGIAAVAVVLSHSLMAFFSTGRDGVPNLFGGLTKYPFYFMFNGGAAVNFFFVLSGFVLVRKYLITGDDSIIYKGAVKRWPRLAFPVLISLLASWVLFSLSLYSHAEAGQKLGSVWLETFGGASPAPVSPMLTEVLYQALIGVFIGTGAQFNTVLWTMNYELVGSFVVFGMALYLGESKGRNVLIKALPLVIVTYLLVRTNPYLITFVLGVLAAIVIDPRAKQSQSVFYVFTAVFAFYLLGYVNGAGGSYAPVSRILGSSAEEFKIYLYAVASMLLIWSTERSSILSWLLSGRVAIFLGKASFPIYLVHWLVLCSIGCWTYLQLSALGYGVYANSGAFAATVVVAFIASVPMIWLDAWWVKTINRITSSLMERDPVKRPKDGPQVIES
jgi:peptidoglycan/LPS O-acetylase OafA/YrhL